MGISSSSSDRHAGWIRQARQDHADAQNAPREDRAHAASVLNWLVGNSSPAEADEGYAEPVRQAEGVKSFWSW